MERGKIRRLVWAVTVAVAIAAVVIFALIPSPISVEAVRVARGPLRVAVDQEGETRVRDRFILSAPVPGRLMRVELEDGDSVRKDQVVARIDPLPLNQREREEVQARVEAAEANLRQANARVAHAREDRLLAARDRTRAEQLAWEGVISAQAVEQARNTDLTTAAELDAAEYSAQVAASEVKVARAGLVSLDENTGKPERLITLRSPVSGRVLRVVEKSERVVQSGTPIVVLGEPSKLEIVTDVLSTDAVKIHPGMAVLLEGWGGNRVIRARVRLVEPYGFTKVSALGVEEQRVNVISDFVDSPGPLGDGYRVEAQIIIWSNANVLKIPMGAIFRHGQGWSTFLVESGRARMQSIEIGHRNEEEVEVLGGISEGQEVITHPSNQISDGARVRVTSSERVQQ